MQSIGCNFIKNNVLLKTLELTFNSKCGLYSARDNLYIRMPMPMPTCRCRDFQMATSNLCFLCRNSSFTKTFLLLDLVLFSSIPKIYKRELFLIFFFKAMLCFTTFNYRFIKITRPVEACKFLGRIFLALESFGF